MFNFRELPVTIFLQWVSKAAVPAAKKVMGREKVKVPEVFCTERISVTGRLEREAPRARI